MRKFLMWSFRLITATHEFEVMGEKNSWYGQDMPRSYFTCVITTKKYQIFQQIFGRNVTRVACQLPAECINLFPSSQTQAYTKMCWYSISLFPWAALISYCCIHIITLLYFESTLQIRKQWSGFFFQPFSPSPFFFQVQEWNISILKRINMDSGY